MSIVKKFINSPQETVPDSLKGLVISDPGLTFSQVSYFADSSYWDDLVIIRGYDVLF